MDASVVLWWCLLGFASGSVPFGYLLARAVGIDVRRSGSGNIGATNVARSAGAWLGILTLAADTAKGVLPTWGALRTEPTADLAAWVALAAVLGHIFCPWLRFRGGKGVATAGGAMAVLAPGALVGALLLFLFVAWTTRYVSLASVAAAVALPVLCFTLGCPRASFFVTVLLAVLITYRHRDNLGRLLEGREPRFGEKRYSPPRAGHPPRPEQ